MRVIGGRFKSRLLDSGGGAAIRPAMDRVKTFIFDVLAGRPEGARVCDLFAGTGSLGIEALSRGAARADFIDIAPVSLQLIRRNLEKLGIGSEGRPIRRDAIRFLDGEPEPYDLVFCDPPYRYPHTPEAVQKILECGWLKPGGILVVEHVDDAAWRDKTSLLPVYRRREFGRTVISMFLPTAAPAGFPVDSIGKTV